MKILITGNMGYVGPGVVSRLRNTNPEAELIGYDIGYFAHCLTRPRFAPEVKLTQQIFGDVRNIDPDILNGVDAIVYLAAISNDPMGNRFEEVTREINCNAAAKMAKIGKQKGVRSFVFASSCSVYGAAGDAAKTETDTLNPLTAYARSKIEAEIALEKLADEAFTITCLRFATACGSSSRLRLDLVVNDFVAGAITARHIDILSDGTPWRPLINVLDMALAIEWAVGRKGSDGGNFLSVNAGSNHWNYQVKQLAEAVAAIVPGCKVSVNSEAPPDKRSYKVNFDLFEKLAAQHQPVHNLESTIKKLYTQLNEMDFNDAKFRESGLMRLNVITQMCDAGILDNNLMWTRKSI